MVRVQADADLNQVIVFALIRRIPRVDFQTAAAAARDGLDDAAVLGLAAREHRILVTHDSKTMPRHFASFIESQASPGVIVVPQSLPVFKAVEDLLSRRERRGRVSAFGQERSTCGQLRSEPGGRRSREPLRAAGLEL